MIALLVFIVFVVRWAFSPIEAPEWTGFGPYDEDLNGPRSKTLWDWLDLILIPAVLAMVAWIYKEFDKTKTKKEELINRQNLSLDNFIKTITELNLEYNLSSDKPIEGTSEIARSRVILVLNDLDSASKGQVLQFLYESNLVNQNPKIKLVGANFRESNLRGIDLSFAEIRGAYFSDSDLSKCNFSSSTFVGCDFTDSDFSESKVNNVDFSYTNLTKCKFHKVDLRSTNLEGATLDYADLTKAKILSHQLDSVKSKLNVKM